MSRSSFIPFARDVEAKGCCAAQLVRFGIGSPWYKRQHRANILGVVESLDPAVVCAILERTHVASAVLPSLPQHHPVSLGLFELETYQRLFAQVITSELHTLGKLIQHLNISAVILKGPALWGNIYPKPWIRRVHDLDILVADSRERQLFIRALEGAGYSCLGDDFQSALEMLGEHYELPTFSKDIVFGASSRDIEAVKKLREWSAFSLRMTVVDDFHLSLSLDLEPHKALFVYRDGSVPIIKHEYLIPSRQFPHFLMMRPPLSLPYLAAKFVLDAARALVINDGTAKCTKLMMDVIGILLRASREEVAESITVAVELQICAEYTAALHCASPLIPEVDMRNLPSARASTVIEQLADMVFTRASQGGRVQEKSYDEAVASRTKDHQ
jgi:hypothetical protein